MISERIPYISRRPNNMVKLSIHLAKSGSPPKFPNELTFPKPGPTFPIVAAAAEKAVNVLTLTALISKVEIRTITNYNAMYKTAEFAASGSTDHFPSFKGSTARGC